MNKLILFFVISVLFYTGYAQDSEPPKFLIEGSGLFTDYSHVQYRQGAGANFDFFLGEHVSTHYVAYFGRDYFEFSPGIIGLPLALLMLSSDNGIESLEDLGFTLFLFAISFENMSFHIKLNDDLYLSPSFNLLRFKYFFEENNNENKNYLCASGGVGIKLNQRIGSNLTIGAFAEAGVLYTKGNPFGYSTGINIGFYLPGRN
jgi:hypothetical protein